VLPPVWERLDAGRPARRLSEGAADRFGDLVVLVRVAARADSAGAGHRSVAA
jgi:hypothetical protein